MSYKKQELRIYVPEKQHNGQKKKNKQRSTKHTHKTKDRVTRTPLKTGGELRCSGTISHSQTHGFSPCFLWCLRNFVLNICHLNFSLCC